MSSDAERALETMLRWVKLPMPEFEYRFAPPRRWRFDAAWPALLWAIEVDGGAWTGGRHTRGAGFEADCEKFNEAALLGWRVLHVTPDMIDDGRALAWIERALNQWTDPKG